MTKHLAFGPLVEYLESRGLPMSTLGMNGDRKKQIEAEGLSVWSADRVAVAKLGVHPSAIWSDWGDLGDSDPVQLTLSGV